MEGFIRVLIAVAGLGLAAIHLWAPDLKVDLTFFALIAVALTAIFARGVRIGAVELMGVKIEFSKQEIPVETTVKVQQPASGPSGFSDLDAYSGRILKLTPIETIVPYVIITSMIVSAGVSHILLWFAFALFLLLTLFYYAKRLGPDYGLPRPWGQILLMGISFAGWAIAMGGPFTSLAWYNAVYGALVLMVTTFLVPFIYTGDSAGY